MRPPFATDRESQLGYFSAANEVHYRWQTEPGYFAAAERALLELAALPTAGRLLEVGCGEGGNLYHLGARPGWVGVDFSHPKLAHMRQALPGVLGARADATALPFADRAFDAVLLRDILHHVPDRLAVVREVARVLRPGGVVAVIEPNGRSPLILAQALLVRAERAVLVSRARRIRDELTLAGLVDVEVRPAQPLPVSRLVLHPALGLSRLGRSRAFGRVLGAAEGLAGRVLPRALWMYLVGRGRKVP